ncbi:MAG TPA: site-specific integrase [Candidatus Alistipes stercoravium]|nr:site-specific integrase [Candidatus Alistipes stercoravium]
MTCSIRFPRRHDKADRNGRYAIRLCITKDKRRKYIALDLYAEPAYWDEAGEQFIILRNLKGAEQKAENKKREADNALLAKYKVRAREIVDRFELEGTDWTLNQFEDAFLNTSQQGKFNTYFSHRIAELHATGRVGNARTYEQTQDMLKKYDRKLDQRLFSDIDLRYVRGFDTFLQKRGCCGNTRKFYFKALRAILNRAKAEGIGSEATYPFGPGGFEVAKLEEATDKRYLPADELAKIKSTSASDPRCEYARKLFLLSYYCYGISFIDMAMLTTAHIRHMEDGDYIVYKRQKIMRQKNVKPISIKISPTIRQLIESLQSASPTVDNFLLPVVTRSGYTRERLYMHIRARYDKYRKYLQRLAEEFQINFRLTSYVSRHTAAMTLQHNHIPREVISQMLGHADLETTNVYLNSFDNGVINEAAKVL